MLNKGAISHADFFIRDGLNISACSIIAAGLALLVM
jgi:hypothetical protein